MFKTLKDSLPALPSYQATYRIIYLEPIAHSGERFTIGVMAQSESEFKVIKTISAKTLNYMYGKNSKQIRRIIDDVILSINEYLGENSNISEWQPLFSGVSVSGPVIAHSNMKMEGVLFQAISSFSSLYQGKLMEKAMSSINEEDIEEDDKVTARLVASVRELIAEPYKKNFNKKIQTLSKTEVTVDYLGTYYNANITNLMATNSGNAYTRAKAKILDIEILREQREKEFINEGHLYEFVVGCPTIPSDKLEDTIQSVLEIAQRKGINAIREHTPLAIAERITKAEMSGRQES